MTTILMLLAAFLQGSATNTSAMKTIDKGTQSSIDDARQVVVRTPEEWAKLWHVHSPDKQVPFVDFSRDMVVGIFLGSKPTAGYAVEIVGTRKNEALVVQYRETAPPPGAMTAQILTMPYHLIVVPKHGGAVKFEKIDG